MTLVSHNVSTNIMPNIRRKVTVRMLVAVSLGLLMFALGWLSSRRNISSYVVNGYTTCFNRASPTYGLPLAECRSVLLMLRQGHLTQAVAFVEVTLDQAAYDAKCRRPLLQDRDLEILDKVLTDVARYRAQFPRSLHITTNGYSGSGSRRSQREKWVAEQKEVDAFLSSFAAATNSGVAH